MDPLASTLSPTRLIIQNKQSYNFTPSPPISPSSSLSSSSAFLSSDQELNAAMYLFQEARRSFCFPSSTSSAYQTPISNNNTGSHRYPRPLTPPKNGFLADSEDYDSVREDEPDEEFLHNVQRGSDTSTTSSALFVSDNLVAFDEDSDDWSSDKFPSEDENEREAFDNWLREPTTIGRPRSKEASTLIGNPERKRKHAQDDSAAKSDDLVFTAKTGPNPSQKKKPRANTARTTAVVSITDENDLRMCMFCLCRETPMWRHGPPGHEHLCNKCGIKWRRGRILQDTRGSITNHNATKRRESTRR